MNMLKTVAWGVEATVISTLAFASYNVAFAGTTNPSDLLAGVPLLTVAALECSRVPVALNICRQRMTGFALSAVLLAGVSVLTFEGATLSFENLIFQRTRTVSIAEGDQAKAIKTRDSEGKAVTVYSDRVKQLTGELEAARKHQTEIAATTTTQSAMPTQLPMPVFQKPVPQPVPAAVQCRTKKGGWYICNKDAVDAVNKANADAERKAQDAFEAAQANTIKKNGETQGEVDKQNHDAQATHDAAITAAGDKVKAAEAALAAAGPAPDMHAYDAAIELAAQRVIDARTVNPMFRVAAAWQKKPVQELTSEEFEQVKHWAVIALAGAAAGTSTLLAVVSSLLERPTTPSKLNRMLRAWIARRRKPIVVHRDVPGPETVKEVEVFRDVPGPETIKTVEVVKEVPGPVEYRPAPGPIEYRDVPGPERVVERVVTKWVPYDINTGLRIKSDGSLGEVANLRSVQS